MPVERPVASKVKVRKRGARSPSSGTPIRYLEPLDPEALREVREARGSLNRIEPGAPLGEVLKRRPRPGRPARFRLHARRPDDLLVFDLLVDNLEVTSGDPPRLVRQKPNRSAALIIELPPQHFGEQAFLDKSGEEAGQTDGDSYDPPFKENIDTGGPNSPPAPNPKNVPSDAEPVPALPAARMRIAGASRLAFTMPKEDTQVELSYAGVLDACRHWFNLARHLVTRRVPDADVVTI